MQILTLEADEGSFQTLISIFKKALALFHQEYFFRPCLFHPEGRQGAQLHQENIIK